MSKKILLNLITNGGQGSGNFSPGQGRGVGKPNSGGASKIRHGSYLHGIISSKILDKDSQNKIVKSRVRPETLKSAMKTSVEVDKVITLSEKDAKSDGGKILVGQSGIASRIEMAYQYLIGSMLDTDSNFFGVTPYNIAEEKIQEVKAQYKIFKENIQSQDIKNLSSKDKIDKRSKVIDKAVENLDSLLDDFKKNGNDYYFPEVDISDLIEK